MAHRVVLAPEAYAQLEAIYSHIAAEADPEVALAFTSAIIETCEALSTFRNAARAATISARACA